MRTKSSEYEIRRQQIIDGALKAFAAKGFSHATNRDIAAAAGIGSPGLIYHYFDSKSDLLHEAVLSRTAALRNLVVSDDLLGIPPPTALRMIAATYLGILAEPDTVDLFRVVLAEALRDSALIATLRMQGLDPVVSGLARYLAAQMAAGRLRRMEPFAAALTFFGPIVAYVLMQQVVRLPAALALNAEQAADSIVTVYLQGMEAG